MLNMSAWLKRNTNKKYTLTHEQESMDQILEGLLESQQPEGVKSAIITRICEQGKQPSHPASTVKNVLQVCCKWILHGTTDLQVSSGFKILHQWGSHQMECFQQYFTPALLAQIMTPGYGNDANAPLLVREVFRVLNPCLPEDLTAAVHKSTEVFIQKARELVVVRNLTLLMSEFNECIPPSQNEVVELSLALLRFLSKGLPPAEGKQIVSYIKMTDEVGNFISFLWRLQGSGLLEESLSEIFRLISIPSSDDTPGDPAICLATLIRHIPVNLANKVVSGVVTDPTVSVASMKCAVGQIVEWLRWPTARHVHVWLSCFLTELAVAKKYMVLIQVIDSNAEKVTEQLLYPHTREASYKIISQMLLSYQHSPRPFHQVLEKLPELIATLVKENKSESKTFLVRLSKLLHCLMYQHSGFPDLYDPVLDLIKDQPVPSTEEMKSCLRSSQWSSQVSNAVTAEPVIQTPHIEKLEHGKTGLENMGNTCYMNSVLQALYMCDQFRRGILSKSPSSSEGLLVQLQHVFASLSLTNRASIKPFKFVSSSRPPWFMAGQQQDCSEFLKYLLDQLHESEKSGRDRRSPGSFTAYEHQTLSRSNSKVDDTGGVTLKSLKKKPEESHTVKNNESNQNLNSSTLIEKIFRGQMLTTFQCLTCKNTSEKVESFSDLPLAFPNSSRKSAEFPQILVGGSGTNLAQDGENDGAASVNNSKSEAQPEDKTFNLTDLIQFYLKPEILTGDNQYHCEKCAKLQDGECRIKILESPQYLILTLNRFSYDVALRTRTKIFQDVKYPLTLAVPVEKRSSVPHFVKQHSRASSSSSGGSIETNNNKSIDMSSTLRKNLDRIPKVENIPEGSVETEYYGLSGVVIHSGMSSEHGHYYCYARPSNSGQVDFDQMVKSDSTSDASKELDLLPDNWYNFNDHHVTHAKFDSFSNVSKRYNKDTAYVLIYCKLDTQCKSGYQGHEPTLRSDLRDAVQKDNAKFIQEQEEAARLELARKRSASVTSATFNKWGDKDDDNSFGGAPGCGDMDITGSRFVF